MGDLREWSLLEDRPSSSLSSWSSSCSFSSNQTTVGVDYWQKAEEATQGIITKVQATLVSEKRRKAVIDYVQNLISRSVPCEVFPFGSVPLKTYLPDGDIDLTAFDGLNVEESLANNVFDVLKREEQNAGAEFMVKDVQLIRAEVKLVKCLVQNIVVDISFNQLGGLCTLCFLEKVDYLIGKDHIFKRSIILIKAWCYYESRILGAHHGLISTYALETLVLYVFHLFHSSLNGPLAVLYKFLDYFSKFDWDSYCISLNGPVRLSSLPELLAVTPDNGGDDLLLSNEFLKECVEMFSVPSRGYETNACTFPPKNLNIVDPLKENNNLGRSVSKGNFCRIRSAFTYGARKLGHILSQPEENIGDEVWKFFSNTLGRHGSGQRPDVQDPFPVFRHDGSSAASKVSGTDLLEDQTTCETRLSAFSSSMTGESRLDHKGSLYCGVTNSETSYMETITARGASEPCKSPMDVASSNVLLKFDSFLSGASVLENHLKGDAKDLATSRIQSLTISSGPLTSSPSSIDAKTSPLSCARHAPHLYFSHSYMANGLTKYGNQDMKQGENSWSTDNKVAGLDENRLVCNNEVAAPVRLKNQLSCLSSIARLAEDFYPSYSIYQVPRGNAGSPEPSKSLSDLSGDYNNHCCSLQYVRKYYEPALTASVPAISPPLMLLMQLRQNGFPQANANDIVPRPGFYSMQLYPGCIHSGMDEFSKQRGTGTFLPKVIHYNRDRPITPRGRHQASVRSPRNNGRVMMPPSENGFLNRSSYEASQSQSYVHRGRGKFGSADITCGSPGRKTSPHATNGSIHLDEHLADFGPISDLPSNEPFFRRGTLPVQTQNSTLSIHSRGSETEGTEPSVVIDKDRISVQSYHLKDDEDFPPLSV